jgi:hypothetical protein
MAHPGITRSRSRQLYFKKKGFFKIASRVAVAQHFYQKNNKFGSGKSGVRTVKVPFILIYQAF